MNTKMHHVRGCGSAGRSCVSHTITCSRSVMTGSPSTGSPARIGDTKFVGIPSDIIGVRFKFDMEDPDWREKADREIVEKLIEKLT